MKSHVPLFTDKVSVKFNPKINLKMKEYKTLNNNELESIEGGGEYAAVAMWWGGGAGAFGFVASVAATAVVVAGGIAAAPVLAAGAAVAGVAALAFGAFSAMLSHLDEA
jgi:bacteriocin-like protein